MKNNKLFFIILLSSVLIGMQNIQCGGIISCIEPKQKRYEEQKQKNQSYKKEEVKKKREPGEVSYLIEVLNDIQKSRKERKWAREELNL